MASVPDAAAEQRPQHESAPPSAAGMIPVEVGHEWKPDIERFIEKIEFTSDCWLWTSAIGTTGYGQFSLDGKTTTASVVAYWLFKGTIPDGLLVCHTCDNPVCVRPSHLFLGTNADNAADRVRKGRSASQAGDLNPRAKLTRVIVQAIRASGAKTCDLAKQYGISKTAIYRARSMKSWQQ